MGVLRILKSPRAKPRIPPPVTYTFLAVLLVILSACSTAGRATTSVQATRLKSRALPASQAIKTVFVIVMENHNWSTIKGNSEAPYINHVMLPSASYANQYYNPPGNHPSLPNYLWLEAGTNCFPDTGCIRDDHDPSAHSTRSHRHLTSLLQRAGISWKAYEENIPGTSCPLQSHPILSIAAENAVPGLSGDLYEAKHDPFVYFHDVTSNESRNSPYCISHIRPFTQLATDLHRNAEARYNFITPNLCDDMHSGCPVLSNRVRQGDRWLSHVIPAIEASAAYRRGGVIFITWDEGEGSDGPIGLIALSPDAKGHGYSNSLHYTHSSLLRTLQEIFHVKPFLGGAARARDLRDLFRRFP